MISCEVRYRSKEYYLNKSSVGAPWDDICTFSEPRWFLIKISWGFWTSHHQNKKILSKSMGTFKLDQKVPNLWWIPVRTKSVLWSLWVLVSNSSMAHLGRVRAPPSSMCWVLECLQVQQNGGCWICWFLGTMEMIWMISRWHQVSSPLNSRLLVTIPFNQSICCCLKSEFQVEVEIEIHSFAC